MNIVKKTALVLAVVFAFSFFPGTAFATTGIIPNSNVDYFYYGYYGYNDYWWLCSAMPTQAYTVVFVVDGAIWRTQSAAPASKITQPPNPTKSGFAFVGWQDTSGFLWNFDTNKVYSSYTVLTAVWKATATKPAPTNPAPTQYTVAFMVGDEVYATRRVEANSLLGLSKPDDPTRDGYIFTGWELSNGTKWNFANDRVTNNTTLVATWEQEEAVISYTITFKVGDEVYDTKQVVAGNLLDKPADPEKDGFVFGGWKEIYGYTWDFDTFLVNGDNTLTAIWDPVATMYTVVFMVDGNEYDTKTLVSGSLLPRPVDPTKEGYNFVGWKTQVSGTPWDFSQHHVNYHNTLVAVWEEIPTDDEDITVLFSGLEGVVIEVYSGGAWVTLNGSFSDSAVLSPSDYSTLENATSMRLRYPGMSYSIQNPVLGETYETTSTITVTDIAGNGLVGISQIGGNWVYSYAPCSDGSIEYVVFNSGQYSVAFGVPGSERGYREPINPGETISLKDGPGNDGFYTVAVPDGISNVTLTQPGGSWIVRTSDAIKAGDTIILPHNDKPAELKYNIGNAGITKPIVLDGTNPFEDLMGSIFIGFPGLIDVTVEYYAETWNALPDEYANYALIDFSEFGIDASKITSVRIYVNDRGLSQTVTSSKLSLDELNIFEVQVSTIVVKDINSDVKLSLASSDWFYRDMPYSSGETATLYVIDGKDYKMQVYQNGVRRNIDSIPAGATVSLFDDSIN